MQFSHLHNHTQFSLLDGQSDINKLFKKAKADGMPAVAITDHGNMFGVFEFVAASAKYDVKPIVGCEFYVVEDHTRKQFTKEQKDVRYHQLLLAKNPQGYKNLVKLCSLGYMEGLYGKYPRVTKALIEQYKEGLIATTCCIGAMVPKTILKKGEEEGETEFRWWLDRFGEDYYVELQRHEIPDQIKVNEVLVKLARKYNVKIIASNDSHYVDRDDAVAHDILLCVNTNEKLSTPKMKDFADDDTTSKDTRFAFYNDEFYFKNTAEMTQLFSDLPESIDNTNEIVGKVETLKLKRDIMLPNFPIPPEFKIHEDDVLNQWEYLKHLTYEGARKRYSEISVEVQERLDFELFTIKTMGFAGYFLIVSDFIQAGRDLGVLIGPGRGCLTGDALVVTSKGTTKRLDEVQIGDCVFTEDGSLRKVKNTFKYDVSESLLKIRSFYGDESGITLTKDHKVFAEKQKRHKNYENWADSTKKATKQPDPTGELTWLKAEELAVGDWVFVPTPKVTIKELNQIDFAEFSNEKDLWHDDNFAYHDVLNPSAKTIQKTKKIKRFLNFDADWFEILGLFAGDGWLRKDYRPEVSFVFNTDDVEKIAWFKSKIQNAGFEISERIYKKTIQIHIRNKHLYLLFKKLFNWYEADAATKHIPKCVLNGSDEQILAFLKGYCFADGHESTHKIKFTTISRMLADQVRFICWRVGIPASLTTDKRISDSREEFKNRKTAYMVSIPKNNLIGLESAQKQYVYRKVEGGIIQKIQSIEEVNDIKNVYDIEVDTHHNYLTSSFLVHNSAAGSAVAYCIGITNIDPIKYQLLFERFLNPDRKSMPDIDTDFDDEGRQKVIDYVVEKYGKRQVAQIVTYGTMATKSSIKDVARVMEYPLADTNIIAKLIPDRPAYGMDFEKLIHRPITGEKSLNELGLSPDEIENVKKVREIYKGNDLASRVLHEAEKLEGNIRNTGIHAAGIIIAPSDLTEILPVSTAKDSDLLVTQYEGKIIEDAGVIKMDFLGLRNLTIIKDCLRLIKENHGANVSDIPLNEKGEYDIDSIPLDDKLTYELLQRGETNAVFQFESDGMKKYMKDLKPDRLDDLIAMNALYRPGPIAYIPNFINRKHGREEITYDLDDMKEFLEETYGITVYQEQVMLLSQKLAGFSKGDADVLRKAMGKKDRKTLDKLKPQFIEGAAKKGHSEKTLEKIWTDWEAFASYAFNKSHSTCYAFVAYQTAYLKAHYPAEYMAAVLTSQLGNIEKITFFLEECKAMGIPVLGPDVNESKKAFSPNKKGEIRFGLGGIKGTGDAAVDDIIEKRTKDGPYKDIFDFMVRVNLRTVNKKSLESMAYAGAFDCFEDVHRGVYFDESDGTSFIEKIIRYANKHQENKDAGQNSLFGALAGNAFEIAKPKIPFVEPWGDIQKLKFEKEVVGFYISGHPLDQFAMEMSRCVALDQIFEPHNHLKEFAIGGVVSAVQIRQSKNGNPFAIVKLEDYTSSIELALFGQDYVNFTNFLQVGLFLFIRGKVQSKWGRQDEFEFKPLQMELLSEIRKKLFKEVKITIGIQAVNAELVAQINAITDRYPGNVDFKLNIYDVEEKLDVQMLMRKGKVALSNDMAKELKELLGEKAVAFA